MIDGNDDNPFTATLYLLLAITTSPAWLPGAILIWTVRAIRQRRLRKALRPAEDGAESFIAWLNTLSLEQRTVVGALISAGEPITNQELAQWLRVSPGEASRRVKSFNGSLVKRTVGREVRIALPYFPSE